MRKQSGQATIEAAVVIPILVLFVLLFAAVQIRLEAQSEVDAAVSLAVAASVIGPVYPVGQIPQDCAAQRTFHDTITQYKYFSTDPRLTKLSGNGPIVGANVCYPGSPQHNGCGPYIRGSASTLITCTGTAQLSGFIVTGLSFLPGLFTVSSTASANASPYRTDCGNQSPQQPLC
jgi:hypothetical protein